MEMGSHIHHIHTYSSLKTVQIDATYFLPYSWVENEGWWTTRTRSNPATALFYSNIYISVYCMKWSHIVHVVPWFFFCSFVLWIYWPLHPLLFLFLLIWRLQLTPSLFAQMFGTTCFFSIPYPSLVTQSVLDRFSPASLKLAIFSGV